MNIKTLKIIKTLLIGILVLLSTSTTSYGQLKSVEIDYKFTINTTNGEFFEYFKKLKDDGKSTLYSNADTATSTTRETSFKINKTKDHGIYINKTTDKLAMFSPILNKDYYIKEDSISERFDWVIDGNVKKVILNYECKLARCKFRGREYKVFFTESLPFFSGPWKLCGLPGTILEAQTVEGMYKFMAIRISINSFKENIKNPYEINNIQFLPFLTHKKILLKKIIDLQKKAQSQEKDEDVDYAVTDTSIELLK